MKNHQSEIHVSTPRRRLFGAVAGTLAGIVGLKVGSRKQALASTTVSSALGSNEPARAPSSNPIVVQPAPHSVKRHG
jgi:hypothetical protein